MSEAKNFRYYRISINEQPDQVSRLSSFPLLSCSSKYVTEIYRAHYMGTPYLCSSIRGAQIWRPASNIWFQYRHKFNQLFTANEQIIPLNTFSDTFTIQRA